MIKAPAQPTITLEHPVPTPQRPLKRKMYLVIVPIVIMHLLVPLAFLPYTFVWWGIPVILIGNFIFGSLGINLGYHRMLTHSAAKFPELLERLWVLLGVCSFEGSPLFWVCTHRIHHQHSDDHPL